MGGPVVKHQMFAGILNREVEVEIDGAAAVVEGVRYSSQQLGLMAELAEESKQRYHALRLAEKQGYEILTIGEPLRRQDGSVVRQRRQEGPRQ